jgi:1,4-dihydroxy-2-naphthoate octaprenyltransferase
MVMGSDFVLTGHYSWTAFFASLVPFFLVSNLLLLNQFPDVDADRSVGRRHLPILWGRKASSYVYSAFLVATYLSIVAGVIAGALPPLALLGLLALILVVRIIPGVVRYADDLQQLGPYLGMNVLVTIITPVLTAIGLFLAAWLAS